MAKITDEIIEVVGRTKGWALATASKDGMPNVVTVGNVKVISENEILIMNNFFGKTLKNLKDNPDKVAIAAWDWDSAQGYQFKGKVRFEESGKNFDDGVHLVMSKAKARLTLLEAPNAKKEMLKRTPEIHPQSAVILEVDSIYVLTPGPQAGKKVA